MKKVKPTELEAEAQRLIREGKMPSLERLLTVVAQVREEYRPLIIAARKLNEDVENQTKTAANSRRKRPSAFLFGLLSVACRREDSE
jgi:hypothetical protein